MIFFLINLFPICNLYFIQSDTPYNLVITKEIDRRKYKLTIAGFSFSSPHNNFCIFCQILISYSVRYAYHISFVRCSFSYFVTSSFAFLAMWMLLYLLHNIRLVFVYVLYLAIYSINKYVLRVLSWICNQSRTADHIMMIILMMYEIYYV